MQAKTTAIIQAGLITTVIQKATKDARVWGVTCDGTTTTLRCKLNGSYEEIGESFSIPGVEWKVMYITLICWTKINNFYS